MKTLKTSNYNYKQLTGIFLSLLLYFFYINLSLGSYCSSAINHFWFVATQLQSIFAQKKYLKLVRCLSLFFNSGRQGYYFHSNFSEFMHSLAHCYLANYHQFNCLNDIHLLFHSSIGQKFNTI